MSSAQPTATTGLMMAGPREQVTDARGVVLALTVGTAGSTAWTQRRSTSAGTGDKFTSADGDEQHVKDG